MSDRYTYFLSDVLVRGLLSVLDRACCMARMHYRFSYSFLLTPLPFITLHGLLRLMTPTLTHIAIIPT